MNAGCRPPQNWGIPEKHERRKTPIEPGDSKAAAGDLSAYFGSQIAFNQIVALGALKKSSNGTYVQANGYNEGG